MLLPSVNNDQNIIRVLPKMNENFQHENNKLPDNSNSINFNQFTEDTSNNIVSERLGNSVNSTSTNCKINGNLLSANNCQTADFEVKALKEWLILHNDLIQQQNEEIIEKDLQIYNLQKENEMLKERLVSLEKNTQLQIAEQTIQNTEKSIENPIVEDMTQDDVCLPYDENTEKQTEVDHSQTTADNVVTCSLEITNYDTNPVSDEESQIDTTIDEENFTAEETTEDKSEDYTLNDLSDSAKTESDTAECNKDCLSEYNFTVNNITDPNSVNNIKMSICRKKINNSSVMPNEPVVGEKKTYKRNKRKRKREDENASKILTTKEPYVSTISEENNKLEDVVNPSSVNATLEVPRWRIKHYTSCYTMEGTENLDDEVFNKRHMRLENHERRRKRWDIQRIREQRVIEKLKQREEKKSNITNQVDQNTISSLLPSIEDIKYIEVTNDLPVSAFGYPIPKLEPSFFTLPWLNESASSTSTVTTSRKSTTKRSNVRKRKRSRNKR